MATGHVWTLDAITDVSVTIGNPDGSQSVYGFDTGTGSHTNPIVDAAISLRRGGNSQTGAVVITINGVDPNA